MRRAPLALVVAVVPACDGGATASFAPVDAGCDASEGVRFFGDTTSECNPPPATAPFACGTQTCGVTQYCISPCCGGAPPRCTSQDDAGACPPGTHYVAQCSNRLGGDLHCEDDPCKPRPPFCSDDAGGCFGGAERGITTRHVGCICE